MSEREIDDSEEMVISGGFGRPLQKRRRRKDGLTEERATLFIEELAATCNVRASARAAGVHPATVYHWRERDPVFRARWENALDHGYAALEIALLEQARLAAGEELPTDRQPCVGAMDAKLAFAIFQNHQKHRGKPPGEARPKRSDLSVAVTRLEQALKRFGPKPLQLPAEVNASETGDQE